MKAKLAVPIACLLLSTFIAALSSSADNRDAAASGEEAAAASATVLVELFTSEGCSSCPPADKLLTELEQSSPLKGVEVIALSEHVDYWNRLGWKDPFSSAEFSQRQADYGRVFKSDDLYTPQMVVDGQTAFVGSKADAAREAIANAARAPKAAVSLTIKAATAKAVRLSVQIDNLPEVPAGDSAEVVLAITESDLLSNVVRGENKGRNLAHSAVTRKLARVGTIKGKTFSAEPAVDLNAAWKRQNLKAVVFVQERTRRRVLGAAAIKLTAES